MEESFARVEIKYMLDEVQAARMENGLREAGFMWMDFGDPTVQSLYYDTSSRLLIRQSLERPSYKEKLRLRTYGKPDSITASFIEIKKKYNGVVYKRRVAVPLEEAMDGLARDSLVDAGQVGQEALWMVRRYRLMPSAVIAYERDAWFSEQEPDIRITFDRNLRFRDSDPNLRSRAEMFPLTQEGQCLMEIKTGGIYPLWLTRLLYATGAKRIHFSKYGLAYLRYMRRKMVS